MSKVPKLSATVPVALHEPSSTFYVKGKQPIFSTCLQNCLCENMLLHSSILKNYAYVTFYISQILRRPLSHCMIKMVCIYFPLMLHTYCATTANEIAIIFYFRSYKLII